MQYPLKEKIGPPDLTVLPAFLSLGGFTEEARAFGLAQGIGMAEEIAYADF